MPARIIARQVGVGRADHAHLDLALACCSRGARTGRSRARAAASSGRSATGCRSRRGTACRRRRPRTCPRARGRAGVRAGLGAEQLGLDQLRRQRAAVERDERPVAHRGVRLDDLGDLLLAGAVRAGDQHRHVGARDLAGERDHALHRRIGEHHAAQVVASAASSLRAPRSRRRAAAAARAAPAPSSSRFSTVASSFASSHGFAR